LCGSIGGCPLSYPLSLLGLSVLGVSSRLV
jgi:hypothetical protein